MPPPFEDNLSKYMVGSILVDGSNLEVGSDLLPDAFRADVLFVPDGPLSHELPGAGRLADWAGDRRCVLEAFSGKVQAPDLRSCVAKLSLAMWRGYKDGIGYIGQKGCLLLLTTYWPRKAIDQVLGNDYETIEGGVRRWVFGQDLIYMINTKKIVLDEGTILFRLLGNKGPRREAVTKIFEESIEPYVTLLNAFDKEFQEMATTGRTQQLTHTNLKDMEDLRDTREEVLRELGRNEGREIGLHEGLEQGRVQEARRLVKRVLQRKFPAMEWSAWVQQVGSLESLEDLMDQALEQDDPDVMRELVEQAVQS